MSEHIKITGTAPSIQYAADGSTTSFVFPFAIFRAVDLGVYLDQVRQTSGYVVNGVGDSASGTVQFDAAPQPPARVTLRRELVIERTSDFQVSGEFRANVLNDELDYQTAALQQIAAQVNRSLGLAPTDEGVDLTLPGKAARAGKVLGFDEDGRPIAADGGSSGSGASDHGALGGLDDDDHPQYHTDARGDARYSVLGHDHDAGPYARLAAVGGAARWANPLYTGILATPPVIATGLASALPAGYTKAYLFSDPGKRDVFTYNGGIVRDQAGRAFFFSRTLSGVEDGAAWSVSCTVDAAKLAVVVNCPYAGENDVRLIADGQYVSATSTTVTADGQDRYIEYDFTAAGGRKARHIVFEGERRAQFVGMHVAATESLHKAYDSGLRFFLSGDSYTDGAVPWKHDAFSNRLVKLLGVANGINNGVGSTGYLTDAGGAQTTVAGRIGDLYLAMPDVVVCTAGYNDVTLSSASITAAVTSYLAAIRGHPGLERIPIFVTGVFAGARGPNQATLDAEAAIAAGVAAMADANTFFIPVSTDPNGPWLFGTGKVGAANGSGNSDLYIQADGAHPSEAGHLFIAERLADAILRIVRTKAGVPVTAAILPHAAVKLDDLAPPDDTTDLDATAARHGLLRKLSNNATDFLNGQGGWSATGDVTATAGPFANDNRLIKSSGAGSKNVKAGVGILMDTGQLYGVNYCPTFAEPVGSGSPKAWTIPGGGLQEITLDATGHTVTISAAPQDTATMFAYLRVIQGAGGAKTIGTWAAAAGTLVWVGGAAPSLKTGAGEWDLFQFIARRKTSGDQIIIGFRLGASS